jgi:hypothetical protein
VRKEAGHAKLRARAGAALGANEVMRRTAADGALAFEHFRCGWDHLASYHQRCKKSAACVAEMQGITPNRAKKGT